MSSPRSQTLAAVAISLAVLMSTQHANAFGVEQMFSNADGSVQFIQMGTNVAALAGVELIATDADGVASNRFTFPHNLPGNASGGGIFLVGTQGFADLKVLQPDYIVPNGFFFRPRGSISVKSHGVVTKMASYSGLPADGMHAVYPDGDIHRLNFDVASAWNFAGQSYQFPRLPTNGMGFGGLWWNAPAGSESGWGIAVERQGGVIFAVWATYGTDGSPIWFVVPRAIPYVPGGPHDVPGPNTHEGTMYRMTGPALGTSPFDTSKVTATPVAIGGFHFDTAGDSVFYYGASAHNPNGGSTYKSITRQVFATPLPACAETAAPGPPPNFQGMWWNPAESGWGMYVAHQGDVVFALLFTYDATGRATWLSVSARKIAAMTYTGALVRSTGPAYSAATFDPTHVTAVEVGTATLAFADIDNGTFSYALDNVAQSKGISRQIFGSPREICE